MSFVSPFTPRECGIATYTANLGNSINILNPNKGYSVIAIEDLPNKRIYPNTVKGIIEDKNLSSYLSAAYQINRSNAQIISLQHEYGLYGGECGNNILKLIEKINKPIVITFHTVLSKPSSMQRDIIQRLSSYSKALIVMANEAERRLLQTYGIGGEKIVVIPHGVPDFAAEKNINYKQKLGYPASKVITIFGLLSANKGIEYAIEAMPRIIKKVPEALFLIIGKTHPVVSRNEGENYRAYLELLVRKLGLTENVRFINKYLSTDEIMFYLKATDVYITPYLEKEQITSGTLAYALGAGKPIISTPYAYAKELLRGGRGVLVPFRNSRVISDKMEELLQNESLLQDLSKKSYTLGRQMIWENVAHQHLDLFSEFV